MGLFWEYVVGADGTSIGTGYQNTMDIINQGCETCYGYAYGGYGITAQAALDAKLKVTVIGIYHRKMSL